MDGQLLTIFRIERYAFYESGIYSNVKGRNLLINQNAPLYEKARSLKANLHNLNIINKQANYLIRDLDMFTLAIFAYYAIFFATKISSALHIYRLFTN